MAVMEVLTRRRWCIMIVMFAWITNITIVHAPAFDAGVLATRRPLPHDVEDAIENYPAWERWFSKYHALGLVLLMIGLKFPIARQTFLDQLKCRSKDRDKVRAVFEAMRATATTLVGSTQYLSEVDDIKASGSAHGFCIYATRLNIWRLASDGAWSLNGKRYTLLDITGTARKTIGTFFSEALHEYLLKMTRAASVQTWNAGFLTFGQEVRKVHVPLLGGRYNPEWIYRVLQVCRMKKSPKIQRLHFTPSDLVVSLPGPDEKGNLQKLARILGGVKTATVQQLYDHPEYAPQCRPEFVSMVLCLAKGDTLAAPDVSRFTGPCVACKEAHKGLEHCRVKKAHTQPSVPKKRKRKQTDSDSD